jgi:hypothetical protein
MYTAIITWTDGTSEKMEMDIKGTPIMEADMFFKMLTKMAEDIVIQLIKDGDIQRGIYELADVQLVQTDKN